MKQSTTKSSKKLTLLKPVLIILPVLLLVWLGYNIYQSFTVDYAYQTAKPIEDALIQAGAKKMCSRGSNGREIDNQTPWYGAKFEIKTSVEETKQILKNALAKDNQLSITDFKRDTERQSWEITGTKPNPYSKLEEGQAAVNAGVEEQKHFDPAVDEKFCTLSGEGTLPGATTLSIGIDLPTYK